MLYNAIRAPQSIVVTLAALLGCTTTVPAAEPLTAPSPARFSMPKNLAALVETADAPSAGPESCNEDSSDCRKWCSRFIPYGWVPGFHGDLTVRNVTAPVDVSIGKTWDIVVDSIDFAAMGQIEASNGQFGFIFNGIYVDVSPKQRVRNLSFFEDLVLTILDFTATVNLEGVPESIGLPEGSQLEVLAGVRYVALSAGVTVTGPQGASAAGRGTEDWFDPIIGSRLRVPVGHCFTAQVRGDVGGFDIGEASRLTWNVEATLEYRCSDRCSLIGGYRWLDIDRTDGSGARKFQFDINMNGPILGFAFDF